MTFIVVCDALAAWRVSSRNESQVALCSESKYAEQSSYHTEKEREREWGAATVTKQLGRIHAHLFQ